MNDNCFENREISWLRFNERVLEEAEDERVPLCERLSFLSIFQTNLDEFFRVRIGSLHDEMMINPTQTENKTGMTPEEQISASVSVIRSLCERRDNIYYHLMRLLGRHGRKVISLRELDKPCSQKMKKLFKSRFLPYLTIYYVGNRQPFPFLKNGEIYAIAVIKNKQVKKRVAVIPCGNNVFPRLVAVPDHSGCYILAEEMILHFIGDVFTDGNITEKSLVRVTRNADIDADSIYDEEMNYRDHMSAVIKQRDMLDAVRIELSEKTARDIVTSLCRKLTLSNESVFEYRAPLEFSFIRQLCTDIRSIDALFYRKQYPQKSSCLKTEKPIIGQIETKDVLIHYPYESIRHFLALLNEAAHDTRVKTISMTLYRLADDSIIAESLAEAAENGKQVFVFVELKARLDEEKNIEWSRRLETAGCKVIYGIEHIKVHSKLCLIGYTENETNKWITQIGTGNYNEKTSRLYTDFCLITSNNIIAEEANFVFDALKKGETPGQTSCLFVAPDSMRNHLEKCIDDEIAKAKDGKPAMIRLKMNSLTDKELMLKLTEASRAGVRIRMIIRGTCCLIAGVKGQTENIEIISIVGRYLEHSRIYMFGQGTETKTYISSADFMTRNMNRRVEIACPVFDQNIRERLSADFEIMWQDNRQARKQMNDGSYVRLYPENEVFSSQDILYENACKNAQEQL